MVEVPAADLLKQSPDGVFLDPSRRNKIVIKTGHKTSACTSRIREGPSIFHKLPTSTRKPVTQDRTSRQPTQAPAARLEQSQVVDNTEANYPKGDKKRKAEENKEDSHLPTKPVHAAEKKRRTAPTRPPKLILQGIGSSMYSKEYELCGCAREDLLQCHRCKLLRLVEHFCDLVDNHAQSGRDIAEVI
ncbi:hypothetical protein HYPSUDRAFT_62899 [Hypholoma sublateritium FD-334 SS-4]|uniref:Uncharacterized protein n=1 Tax=Hypholoma sublateritium (strain FD-334 SS-4) TaxID=945553 RepID=A0A0D2MV30_HYPSF|nr:hypothetical protein HYPSUDRAFT_62899 [Hypholoma sublateritium FD-334 SS-4]